MAAVFFFAAMLNTALRLRPDPLVVAGGTKNATDTDGRTGTDRNHPKLLDALQVIGASPNARLAVAAMVVSQVTMVSVMAMTPVHLKLHGHENVSQYVVSLHVAGMFAFSPIVGRYCDRRGKLRAILFGSSILLSSTVIAAASGDIEQLLFPSLWLLGLGWNFGLIGGSSLLIDSVSNKHRVSVQGSADLMMGFCGGMAGFASGFVRRAIGYHMLANSATLAAGGLLIAAYMAYRSRSITLRSLAPQADT